MLSESQLPTQNTERTGRRQLVLFVLLAALLAPAVHADKAVSIRFGVVPQFDQRRIVTVWQPILDELHNRIGVRFKLVGSSGIRQFEKNLAAGKFDCAYMNPYDFTVAHRRQGYAPLVRDHAGKLSGILVVAKNSGIYSPWQLAGRIIAFPSPNALGASLLMRHDLHSVYGIQFTPRYVKTHSSVYLNVATGMAVAGGGVRRTLQEQPLAVRNRLRVIYETRSVAAHPIACSAGLAPTLRLGIRDALLAMGREPSGSALLARIPIRRIGPAELADYAWLAGLHLPVVTSR